MIAATAASWVFAALLAIAGVRKVVSPAATGAALQGARLPSDHRLVRLLGAGELLVAGAVPAWGGAPALLLLGLAYGAFAIFAERQRLRGAGCGCFGESDAPATRLHVAIDAVGAIVAVAAAARPGPSLIATLGGDIMTAALALLLLGLGAVALQLALTALPELAAAAALTTDRDTA